LSHDHEPQHDHNLNVEVEVNEDNIVEENSHPSFDEQSHIIDIAKEIAEEMDIEPIFPTPRKGKRKKHFDEQNDQNEETLSTIVFPS
jgi:hypothetical protein